MEKNFCIDEQDRCPVQDAVRIQYCAAEKGFDWQEIQGVLLKVREELGELDDAIRSGNETHANEELGDLLFACFSVARFLKTDPVMCLDHAAKRFAERFECVEKMAFQDGRVLGSCTAEVLDAYWERAKKLMRQ